MNIVVYKNFYCLAEQSRRLIQNWRMTEIRIPICWKWRQCIRSYNPISISKFNIAKLLRRERDTGNWSVAVNGYGNKKIVWCLLKLVLFTISSGDRAIFTFRYSIEAKQWINFNQKLNTLVPSILRKIAYSWLVCAYGLMLQR